MSQAKTLINEQAACSSTVTSACEAHLREDSKATALLESLRQLNMQLAEKAVFASRRKVMRSLEDYIQAYDSVFSTFPIE